MVKSRWKPCGGVVARLAVGAERTLMSIVLGMAGVAGRVQSCKYIIQVTERAGYRAMGTR